MSGGEPPRPAERGDANGTISSAGNDRSRNSSSIVEPTAPVAPTTPDKKSVTAKPDRKAGGLKNKRGPEIFIENIPECFACSNMPQRSPETCRCFVTDVRTRCDWMWKVER